MIYFSDNGTYTGLCSDPKIQEILAALGGSGSAACATPDMYPGATALIGLDFGIAATFDGKHFIADPNTVLQLYSTNMGTHTWDNGVASCVATGGRIPGASGLKALKNIFPGTTPPTGMVAAEHWSGTQGTLSPTVAYVVSMHNSTFATDSKSVVPRYVHCGS